MERSEENKPIDYIIYFLIKNFILQKHIERLKDLKNITVKDSIDERTWTKRPPVRMKDTITTVARLLAFFASITNAPMSSPNPYKSLCSNANQSETKKFKHNMEAHLSCNEF